MNRKPTTRVLCRPHCPRSDFIPYIQDIAKQYGSEFHSYPKSWLGDAHSYFTVGGGPGTKRAETATKAIVNLLIKTGLGDEHGVYQERWFHAKVCFSGATRLGFMRLIDGTNGIRSFKYSCLQSPERLRLWHQRLRNKVELYFSGSGECEAEMCCDDTNELRMLVASFCGVLVQHFWIEQDGFRVDLWQEELEWE